MKIGGFSDLPDFLSSLPEAERACFVDTSILFSITYPLDIFNDQSEMASETLAKYSVPLITNQNVRSEFLENHRKVLLAECLVDFYDDYISELPTLVSEKLKSHRTSIRRKVEDGKGAKLNTNQLKEIRELLNSFEIKNVAAWDFVCINYFSPRIIPLWDATVEELGINFLTSRSSESSKFLRSKVNWEDATELIGRYGIASADAMILNIFLSSEISMLITADVEMARCVFKENRTDKRVFLPDSLLPLV